MKLKHITNKIHITWEKNKPLYIEVISKFKKSKIEHMNFLSCFDINDLLESEIYCTDKNKNILYRNKC